MLEANLIAGTNHSLLLFFSFINRPYHCELSLAPLWYSLGWCRAGVPNTVLITAGYDYYYVHDLVLQESSIFIEISLHLARIDPSPPRMNNLRRKIRGDHENRTRALRYGVECFTLYATAAPSTERGRQYII